MGTFNDPCSEFHNCRFPGLHGCRCRNSNVLQCTTRWPPSYKWRTERIWRAVTTTSANGPVVMSAKDNVHCVANSYGLRRGLACRSICGHAMRTIRTPLREVRNTTGWRRGAIRWQEEIQVPVRSMFRSKLQGSGLESPINYSWPPKTNPPSRLQSSRLPRFWGCRLGLQWSRFQARFQTWVLIGFNKEMTSAMQNKRNAN